MPVNVTEEAAEARRQGEAMQGAQARKKRMIEKVGTTLDEEDAPAPVDRRLVFVAPAHPTGKFLVKPGDVLMQPSPYGPWPVSRHGDVFIRFHGGLIIIDPSDPNDQVRLAWLRAHPEIARDADDPQTDLWVKLTTDKHPTSRREASLPANANIEEILDGNFNSFGSSDLMNRARAAVR